MLSLHFIAYNRAGEKREEVLVNVAFPFRKLHYRKASDRRILQASQGHSGRFRETHIGQSDKQRIEREELPRDIERAGKYMQMASIK